MQITIGNAQHTGARERQEDYLARSESGEIKVAVLADGMGGYEGGDQASIAVAKAFLDFVTRRWDTYYQRDSIADLLSDGAYHANSILAAAKAGTNSNMGTTLVAMIIHQDHAWWISVGDSLLYLLRDGNLHKLNAEHSHYYDLRQKVFLGEISNEQAENDPERDGLTSALMGRQLKYVDVSRFGIELQNGDRFLLASDGLDRISENQISSILQRNSEPQQASNMLIQQVIEVNDPQQDNVSVLVLAAGGRVAATKRTQKGRGLSSRKNWSVFVIPMLLLVAATLLGISLYHILGNSDIDSNAKKVKRTAVALSAPNDATAAVATKQETSCRQILEQFTTQICGNIPDEETRHTLGIKFACQHVTTSTASICEASKAKTGVPPQPQQGTAPQPPQAPISRIKEATPAEKKTSDTETKKAKLKDTLPPSKAKKPDDKDPQVKGGVMPMPLLLLLLALLATRQFHHKLFDVWRK